MVWLVIAVGLTIAALTGAPVGIALGAVGMLILAWLVGGAQILAFTSVWNSLNEFVLRAVPLFILMGELLLRSGLSERIYDAFSPIFRRIPGQLLHTNVAVCTVFGAVCGASTATAAAVGSVAYPELSKRGYARPAVLASLAAGGTLGLLIPPSIALLIYGATQGVSIGKLFLAGIMPGVVLAAAFMAFIFVKEVVSPSIPAGSMSDRRSMREIIVGLLSLWPIVILAFIVLGTIYMGIATPTEAAAIGVAATIVLGMTFGRLDLHGIVEGLTSGVVVYASLALVIVGALILAQALSVLGLPTELVRAVEAAGLTPLQVLAVIVLMYLILGCFFDGLSLMLMTLPVVFPLMTSMGFDAIWFGVVLTILIEIGMLTPPVGMNLFVLVAISKGEVSLGSVAREAFPYWLIMLGFIALATLVPGIILWLPGLYNN